MNALTKALTNEQLFRVAPSIFAEAPHDSRSSRYQFIPTVHILNGLRKEGFEPFAAQQTIVRDPSRGAFAKHLVRLRHQNHYGKEGAGDANEIVLLNSHDGSSSYQMMAGYYRFICTNGLVLGDTFHDVRVRHQGDNLIENVIEGAYEVLETFHLVDEHKALMQQTRLTQDGEEAFAETALSFKYDTESAPAPITARQILRPKRTADMSNDVWTVFNRVQEHLLGGGQMGRTKTGRRMTTRAVTGIDSNVRLNRALWSIAEAFTNKKLFQ